MLAPPWLLALGLVLGLLVLIPARRLQLAGLSSRTIGLYALVLWLLTMLVAIRPTAARILVPILVVAYIAPFVAAPDRMGRFLRRGRAPNEGRPPMKNVTPADAEVAPDADVPPDAPEVPPDAPDVPPDAGAPDAGRGDGLNQ